MGLFILFALPETGGEVTNSLGVLGVVSIVRGHFTPWVDVGSPGTIVLVGVGGIVDNYSLVRNRAYILMFLGGLTLP